MFKVTSVYGTILKKSGIFFARHGSFKSKCLSMATMQCPATLAILAAMFLLFLPAVPGLMHFKASYIPSNETFFLVSIVSARRCSHPLHYFLMKQFLDCLPAAFPSTMVLTMIIS